MWFFKTRDFNRSDRTDSGSFGDERAKKGRGLNFFHAEAAAWSLEEAGDNYQSPSLIAAGAQAHDVAVSTSVTNLAFSILLMGVLPGIHARVSVKRATLVIALIGSLGWLPLVFFLLLWGQVTPYLLIALWLVSLVPSVLLVPLRDNWLSELLPASRVGRYLGLRSAISAATYLGAFYIMGAILDSSSGQIFTGYAIVFLIACAASLVSLVLYATIHAPPGIGAEGSGQFGFSDFVREAKRSNLGALIVFISLFTLAVSLASPFFVVYMLKDLHFTYLTYTLIISVEYLARIVSFGFWGRYLDKVGGLRVLSIVSRLIPCLPVLWLFSSSVAYLMIIQLLSGTLWAAFDVGARACIYQSAPEGKRFHYILYHRSLSTLPLGLGALAGSYLLSFVPPIFGNRILGMFLLSGLLRLLAVVCFLPRLGKADVGTYGTPDVHPSTRGKRVSMNEGLLHSPQLWPDPRTANVGFKAEEAYPKPLGRGLFHRPDLWPEYYPALRSARASPNEAAPINRGLFHKREQWHEYYSGSISRMQLP